MININPQEVYNRINDVGQEWVKANAAASMLEESFKSELNTVMQEKLQQGSKSMADAESKARADKRIFDHIGEMVNARKQANEHKVKYDAAKIWFDALRTQASTMRAELTTLSGTT